MLPPTAASPNAALALSTRSPTLMWVVSPASGTVWRDPVSAPAGAYTIEASSPNVVYRRGSTRFVVPADARARRDVRVLLLTSAAYLGATGLYIGDQLRYHGLIRVSSAAVGLGVAAVLARRVFDHQPTNEPEWQPS